MSNMEEAVKQHEVMAPKVKETTHEISTDVEEKEEPLDRGRIMIHASSGKTVTVMSDRMDGEVEIITKNGTQCIVRKDRLRGLLDKG